MKQMGEVSMKVTEAHGICLRRDCGHSSFAGNYIILYNLEEVFLFHELASNVHKQNRAYME